MKRRAGADIVPTLQRRICNNVRKKRVVFVQVAAANDLDLKRNAIGKLLPVFSELLLVCRHGVVECMGVTELGLKSIFV